MSEAKPYTREEIEAERRRNADPHWAATLGDGRWLATLDARDALLREALSAFGPILLSFNEVKETIITGDDADRAYAALAKIESALAAKS